MTTSSSFSVHDARGHRWFVVTVARVVIAVLTLGSIAVAVGCLLTTDHRGPAWPALVVVLLALVTSLLPDGRAALATLTTFAIWWLLAVRDVSSPWVLPAALALLTFHVAVALDASGPRGITFDRVTVWTWWRDGLLVAVPTTVIAAVAIATHDATDTPPVLVGLTVLLVALLFSLLSRRERAGPRSQEVVHDDGLLASGPDADRRDP